MPTILLIRHGENDLVSKCLYGRMPGVHLNQEGRTQAESLAQFLANAPLKAIYSSLRTLEDYKRGNEQRSASEILADKLYWTFQAEKIGDLVSKGADSPLSSSLTIEKNDFF